MEPCEKCRKIYELEELRLEVHALIDILERALKYDEFEYCQNSNNIYLVEIIKNKFENMNIIIENIESDSFRNLVKS